MKTDTPKSSLTRKKNGLTRFQKVIASIALCFALFIGIGIMLPQEWKIERKILIHAKPDAIYPYISNFETGWPQWNMFDLSDDKAVYTYLGPKEGEGAYRSWTSQKIGNGWQKITHVEPNASVTFEMEYSKRKFLLEGVLQLTPKGDDTEVSFSESGSVPNGIFIKYLIRGADYVMGDVLQKSLENLKKSVEVPGTQTSTTFPNDQK